MLNHYTEKILRKIEGLVPKKIYKFFQPMYHYLLALDGAFIYGYPSRKLKVVGVTGTKGKSTTVELIDSILREAGFKTALTSTIHFKIGDDVKPNKYKMSMPGRFFMQKFLRDALRAECDWVILELTSEGAKQFRNKFIELDAFVFTNLSPEHIESHGSFEKYRDAKLSLADGLSKLKETSLIVNGDDEVSRLFLEKEADQKISYSLGDAKPFTAQGSIEMQFNDVRIFSKLQCEFNVLNILAAANFAKSIGVEGSVIKKGIENVSSISGRVERIDTGQNFEVYVDYAHTPDSLEALYKAFDGKRRICVLGNTGGGRDTWKRPEMARIADNYCDEILLTNEDPYDENPEKIINEMKVAILNKPVEVVMDRREAISIALKKARTADVVLITGKGTDPYIMEADGKKTPWSDADVTREELEKLTKR